MKKGSPLGKFFGYIALASISIGVFLFLAKHSLNFFQFTFKDSDVLYSWLGLLMTSAGAIGWLAVFIWLADTTTRKGISLVMMLVALAGEMVTAIFDMQNNGQYASGFQYTPQELENMTFAIGILGAVTGIALIAYAAGDKIIAEFKKDTDGDGIPDFMDRDHKGNKHSNNQNQQQNRPSDTQGRQGATQQQKTNFTIADLERVANMSINEVVRQHPYKKAFKDFAAEKFDYIDGDNLQELWIARPANPTQAAAQNNGRR